MSINQKKKEAKINKSGAEEMAWWLGALATLVEDPGLSLSTHMVAHNHL